MPNDVTVLIPAYNEEGRIAAVLDSVTAYGADQVVVIDDGSTDQTVQEAEQFPVDLIRHDSNQGKGAALNSGIHYVRQSSYWLFIDSDLINLSTGHLSKLLNPLMEHKHLGMTVGMFTAGGKINVDLAQRYFGILNGQRGLSQFYIETLPSLSWARFGVEIFLSKFARHKNIPVDYPILEGLTHWTKEEKLGLYRGFKYRMQMYKECIYAIRHWQKHV